LKWHPDKNPDEPEKAALMFQKIQKAYGILTDDKAKEAFDTIVRARIAKRKRTDGMDKNRRQMKESLEEREMKHKKQKQEEDQARVKLAQEIERLKRDGFKKEKDRMEEEMTMKRMAQEQSKNNGLSEDFSLKITWDRKKSEYSKERLEQIFTMFGEIGFIVMAQKKNRSALISFKDVISARNAVSQVLGDPSNRLNITWASGKAPQIVPGPIKSASSAPAPIPVPTLEQHIDLEAQILQKMLQAQRQKQETHN